MFWAACVIAIFVAILNGVKAIYQHDVGEVAVCFMLIFNTVMMALWRGQAVKGK